MHAEMYVALHIGYLAGRLEGVWYEVADDAVTYYYRDELSPICCQGVERMLRRPRGWTWAAYWIYLAGRIDGLEWWEVVNVDDESYPDEWLRSGVGLCSAVIDIEGWLA